MPRKSRSRKNSVLSTTKKVGMKSVGLLEKGLSGLFGVVKTGVEMGVNDVKKGAKMIASRRRKSKRRKSSRRKSRRRR